MTRCLPLLGSFVEIYIQADISDGELIKTSQKAFEVVKLIHHKMSFHDPLSELSAINKEAFNKSIKLSDMTTDVIGFALKLSTLTDGVFDITTAPLLMQNDQIPKHTDLQMNNIGFKDITLEENYIQFKKPLTLDLGGIAKGYAVDKALEIIQNTITGKLQQAYVNAGGDLKYFNWQNENVLIPTVDKVTSLVKMLNASVATSSSYYKYRCSDIYHPLTRQPANFEKTVSVFSESCMQADGLTKVAALLSSTHPVFKQLNALVLYT